jgi:hypothetical protein
MTVLCMVVGVPQGDLEVAQALGLVTRPYRGG